MGVIQEMIECNRIRQASEEADVQAMTLKTALIVEEDDKDSDMARMSILKRGTECKYQDGMMMANAQLGTDTFESLEPINNRDEESASRKSTMKKKGETIEPANEATTIESAMEEISVEGGENEGMEWKVSENMPIYLCGKAADSEKNIITWRHARSTIYVP
jgi:hypothetical protein